MGSCIRFAVLTSVITGGLVFAACSSFSESESSMDSGTEAGGDTAVPPTSEAGADATAVDAETPCVGGALLCDTFERSAGDVRGPWSTVTFGNGPIDLTIDTAFQKTGNASLHARDEGMGGTGALELDLDPRTDLTVDFDLRLGRTTALSTLLVAYLFEEGTTTVSVAMESGGIKIAEQTGGSNYADVTPLPVPIGTWFHVTFSFKGGNAYLNLPDQNIQTMKRIQNPTGTATALRLGLPFVAGHVAGDVYDVWYDDVVITR